MTRSIRLIAIIGLVWTSLPPRLSEAATLMGKSAQGGGMVEIRFPVAKTFQYLASEGGNPRAALF
jgi:hypothetical protein